MVLTKSEKQEVRRLAEKYSVAYNDACDIIQTQYDFIRNNLKALNLPLDLSEEEFNKLTKNFNIPSIGKLYASYQTYKRLNKL